jgi:hypothetical protein
MTSRKHPSAALWATVVVVVAILLPVLYALSIGPAYWVLVRVDFPEWLTLLLADFYGPLWSVLGYCPDEVFSWFVWYSSEFAGIYYSID